MFNTGKWDYFILLLSDILFSSHRSPLSERLEQATRLCTRNTLLAVQFVKLVG